MADADMDKILQEIRALGEQEKFGVQRYIKVTEAQAKAADAQATLLDKQSRNIEAQANAEKTREEAAVVQQKADAQTTKANAEYVKQQRQMRKDEIREQEKSKAQWKELTTKVRETTEKQKGLMSKINESIGNVAQAATGINAKPSQYKMTTAVGLGAALTTGVANDMGYGGIAKILGGLGTAATWGTMKGEQAFKKRQENNQLAKSMVDVDPKFMAMKKTNGEKYAIEQAKIEIKNKGNNVNQLIVLEDKLQQAREKGIDSLVEKYTQDIKKLQGEILPSQNTNAQVNQLNPLPSPTSLLGGVPGTDPAKSGTSEILHVQEIRYTLEDWFDLYNNHYRVDQEVLRDRHEQLINTIGGIGDDRGDKDKGKDPKKGFFGNMLESVLNWLGPFGKMLSGIGTKLLSFGKLFMRFAGPIALVGVMIAKLDFQKDLIEPVSRIIDLFKSGSIFEGIGRSLSLIPDMAIKAIWRMAADILEFFGFESVATSLNEIAKDFSLYDMVAGIFTSVKDAFVGIVNSLADFSISMPKILGGKEFKPFSDLKIENSKVAITEPKVTGAPPKSVEVLREKTQDVERAREAKESSRSQATVNTAVNQVVNNSSSTAALASRPHPRLYEPTYGRTIDRMFSGVGGFQVT